MSPAQSLLQMGTRLASAPLRVGAAVGERGFELERRARRALAPAGERALLSALDAVLERVLSQEVIDRLLEQAEAAGLARRVADRILEDGIAEQIAQRLVAGPELERILTTVFQSALPEELIAQLLASEAVWVFVDEIARSPSVTEAIAHQGTGFLDQVAAKARDRSREADTRVQRLAARLTRSGRREVKEQGGDQVVLTEPASSGPAQ